MGMGSRNGEDKVSLSGGGLVPPMVALPAMVNHGKKTEFDVDSIGVCWNSLHR
jgi:hypothetical protein